MRAPDQGPKACDWHCDRARVETLNRLGWRPTSIKHLAEQLRRGLDRCGQAQRRRQLQLGVGGGLEDFDRPSPRPAASSIMAATCRSMMAMAGRRSPSCGDCDRSASPCARELGERVLPERAALTPMAYSSLTLPKLRSCAITSQRRVSTTKRARIDDGSLSRRQVAGCLRPARSHRWAAAPRGIAPAAGARIEATTARGNCAGPFAALASTHASDAAKAARSDASASVHIPSCTERCRRACGPGVAGFGRDLRRRPARRVAPASRAQGRRSCAAGSAGRPGCSGCALSTCAENVTPRGVCVSLPASEALCPSCVST